MIVSDKVRAVINSIGELSVFEFMALCQILHIGPDVTLSDLSGVIGTRAVVRLIQVPPVIDQPRKIAAIKWVRRLSGCGLREAKDFVDYLPPEGAVLKTLAPDWQQAMQEPTFSNPAELSGYRFIIERV